MHTLRGGPLDLTIDEEAFVNDGFAVFESAYDATAIKLEVDERIEAEKQAGRLPSVEGSIRPAHLIRCPSVKAFITNSGLLSAVAAFFSGDPVLCSLGANCVVPGGQGMGIHRDYPYLSRHKQRTDGPLLCLQLVLSLDAMDENNGATLLFPGSHRGVLNKPRKMVCPAGSLILFHGALMHAVDANRSSSPRTNLLASFSPYWVRPFSDVASSLAAAELQDERVRHLLGLDFHERIRNSIPYRHYGSGDRP